MALVAIPVLNAAVMAGTGRTSAGLGLVLTTFGAGATVTPLIGGFVADHYDSAGSFVADAIITSHGLAAWIGGRNCSAPKAASSRRATTAWCRRCRALQPDSAALDHRHPRVRRDELSEYAGPGQSGRSDPVINLHLDPAPHARRRQKSNSLASMASGHNAGAVCTGFSEAATALREQLDRNKAPACVVRGLKVSGAVWVSPDLRAEIAYRGITTSGELRHASFKGLDE